MEWLPGDLFQSKQKNEENIIMTINRERLYVLDVNNIFYRGEKYKTNWSYSHDKFAFYLVSSCRSRPRTSWWMVVPADNPHICEGDHVPSPWLVILGAHLKYINIITNNIFRDAFPHRLLPLKGHGAGSVRAFFFK